MNERLFNRKDRFAEGWYWALRSSELAKGKVKALNLMGRELAIYRDNAGKVSALDAYCPHMGAHLAEGCVDGQGLRCFFHGWKFGRDGRCQEVPALGGRPAAAARLGAWPVEERYGLIWVWTGVEPRHGIPCPPELEGEEVRASLGRPFEKNCHPNVVMINAIDAHHFNTVHRLPVRLEMEPKEMGPHNIRFSNATRVPDRTWWQRFIGSFYSGALTYAMSYWWGSNGTVTLGPDFLHFYIMFALRPTSDGRTEGQTVLITKRRHPLVDRVLLFLTQIVGNYFAEGDTRIFRTIRFDLKTPIQADAAIVRFVGHLDKQKVADWGFSKPEAAAERSKEAVQ
jgi:phenylpropionate dioxygenase-like ring-hydroxylating dioxygenase large terminal subunit